MLNVPDEIKELLHRDSCKKNIRIHFPNGERTDICNDLIVKDSVSFTESLCSQNELKFGLCESPVFECEVVGVGNIKGAAIEVYCEIVCPASVSGAVFRPDLQEYVYPIPYGIFTVDSCKRQADMNHRRIVAYSFYDMGTIQENYYLRSLLYTNWFDSTPLIISPEVIESLFFKLDATEYARSETPVNIEFDLGDLNSKYYIYVRGYGLYYTDYIYGHYGPGTKFDFVRSEYRIADSFDLDGYLQKCEEFKNRLWAFLDSTGDFDDDLKEKLSWFTRPHVRYKNSGTYIDNHYNNLTLDYCVDAFGYHGPSDNQWVNFSDSDTFAIKSKAFSTFKWNLYYYYSQPSGYWASNMPYLFAPGLNFSIHIANRQTSESTSIDFGGPSIDNVFLRRGKAIYYDSVSYPDNSLLIPKTSSASFVRKKTSVDMNLMRFDTITNQNRTEYVNNFEFKNLNIREYYEAAVEKSGRFAFVNRYGFINHIDIKQKFGLDPGQTLYPGSNVHPQGVTGGSIKPNDYQSCWYEDDYAVPFGAVRCAYKDANNVDRVFTWYISGFDEETDVSLYQVYDLSDNYLIKSRAWTQQEISDICESIADNIKGVSYMPVDFVGRGLPYVEAGDTFEILTKSNDSITTIVLNRTISGEQVLTDSYKSV